MKIDPGNMNFRERHHLFSSTTIPRPVFLISTISEDGIYNVAPFASIVTVSVEPSLRGFEVSTRRDGQTKDTLRNIWFTNDFVINVVHENMAEAMNQTSADYPPEVDEFKEVGLTPVQADIVKSPLVGESAVNMECKVVQILEFGEFPRISRFIIGEVLLVHVKDDYLVNGEIDKPKLKAIGRLGGEIYCRTSDTFELKRSFVL
jgi:flavin reductase (DIM6/NTAB) family NADH-FMN oxidoreductase RutF